MMVTAFRWTLLFAVALLLLGACTRADTTSTVIPSSTPASTPTPTPTPSGESTSVNLIAYVGTDGALYTIGPGGGEPSRLMGEAQGQMVDLVADQGPDNISAEVYSITTGSQATRLYQDPPGVIPIIADNTRHYMYWSPDSRHLTFLAKATQNMDLFVRSMDF